MAEIRRDYRIDVLRGLAILSVLLLHFNLSYRLIQSPIGKLLPQRYMNNLLFDGNYGVIVFFVISGYLITSTSLRRFGSLSNVSLRDFYLFRFARIFPCLLLALALVTGFGLAGVEIFRGEPNVSLWLSDLSILTFWHNVMMDRLGYFNYCLNVYWSLSVEEVFYLAFPVLCVFLKKPRWIVPVWAAAIIAGPIYRHMNSHNEIRFLYGYLACFDAIAMGCCVAVLVRSKRFAGSISAGTRATVQAVALIGMAGTFVGLGIDDSPTWGPSLMAALAAIFLIAEGVGSSDGRSRLSKIFRAAVAPIAWFGRHSYEIYLFHVVLLAWMHVVLPKERMSLASRPLWLVVFVVASVLVAWAIARWYSEPLNGWIRRYFTSSKALA